MLEGVMLVYLFVFTCSDDEKPPVAQWLSISVGIKSELLVMVSSPDLAPVCFCNLVSHYPPSGSLSSIHTGLSSVLLQSYLVPASESLQLPFCLRINPFLYHPAALFVFGSNVTSSKRLFLIICITSSPSVPLYLIFFMAFIISESMYFEMCVAFLGYLLMIKYKQTLVCLGHPQILVSISISSAWYIVGTQ